jgi:small redox-active disulfide protein 2
MLDIQIAGPGCRNCHEMKARVIQALEALGAEATVRELSDFKDIAAAGVLTTPGLIVNGKILVQGKLPAEGVIRGWLLEALRS